ncbi:MAG: DUF763 domain-containing protein [Candidatus Thermoplasmatota archaeon]
MVKTGTANLPLHPGRAPRWLFKRMVKLSRGITDVMIYEYSREEFLRRLSDPFWFQAFSCALGFDWHSSGTTTVTCGALKEAIDPEEYGFAIAGGKGKASLKTLDEIMTNGENFCFSSSKIEDLKYSSRMTAKVDNSAVQDDHQLYHHVFAFTEDGCWCVIQQGLNPNSSYARRYHWFSKNFDSFVSDPHDSILGEKTGFDVLDMVSKDSGNCQKTCVDLINDNPQHLQRDWSRLTRSSKQKSLDDWANKTVDVVNVENLDMPRVINWRRMREIYEFQPTGFEELLSMRGVGPKTVRALALISDLIYGDKPSWDDPVKYSFAVGGKDGVPFPVDQKVMDESTSMIKQGVEQAKLGDREKLRAFKRLKNFVDKNQ